MALRVSGVGIGHADADADADGTVRRTLSALVVPNS
jgi:CHASE2 domain-containing sensor protein